MSMTIFELLQDSNPKEYEKISKMIVTYAKIEAHKAITTYLNEFSVCKLHKENII